MRTLLPVLVSAFLYGTATAAFAQNVNDIIDRVQGIVQSTVTKAAQSEWGKLPQPEFSCVNQKLQERGESIASFIKRGILPSDSRVSHLRSECRSSQVLPPLDQRSARSKYVVGGIAVGS